MPPSELARPTQETALRTLILSTLTLGAALALPLAAETPFRAAPGRSEPVGAHALMNASRVILEPGRQIEDATVLVRDGRIEAIGRKLAVPADAIRHDCRGMTIWPGFVDAHVEVSRLRDSSAALADSALSHDNARVRAERRVRDLLQLDPKKVKELRDLGFTAAALVPDAGILRGRDVVVQLGEGDPSKLVVREGLEQHAAFESGSWGDDSYPSSTMGAMALLRQSLLDADWHRRAWDWAGRHASAPRPETDASLEALAALAPQHGRPSGRLAFECEGVLDALRALEVSAEFELPIRITGWGDEYRRLKELAAAAPPLVLPVNFPEAPTAANESEWLEVSMRELRHWKHAPDNPRWLHEAGVDVSLSTHRLKSVDAFPGAVRRSIEKGLSEEQALAMVTTRPAALLGLSSRLGSLAVGKDASFVLAHGGPFDEGREIREVWVAGTSHVVSRVPDGVEGAWTVVLHGGGKDHQGTLRLEGTQGSFTPKDATPLDDDEPEPIKLKELSLRRDGASLQLPGKAVGLEDTIALDLRVAGAEISGASADGALSLTGRRRLGPDPDRKKERVELPAPPPPPMGGPVDEAADWLLRGATVWTVAEEGVLENADVLVRGGRIAAVGRGLVAPRGVAVIEAAGRHLSPGLIDAHSHAAIVGGVNEGTNSCTAEVRIGDVLNSETDNLYHQLAGGLTAANLMHGSANCMGGQSQVIKLRHGAPPSELKFREAEEAIKFALGENVKQANWGEKHTTRFPQTRMGVEQFMRQKFLEAQDYRDAWTRWSSGRDRAKQLPPRRELQLETLVEILEGKRKIHCHSYRQDEILMLMRVAEEFGFRVGTFQHILEGYKVADEMAEHGAMGSSFTDWWAFKFEVYDAIPYNPSLMRERGVTVSVNSDSTELARRMHLEAAKVAKWGGLDDHEALKFVTINPAMQLGVAGVVGSIEAGKHADLVLWSGPPLSTSSRALRTWIDGQVRFDLEDDRTRRLALSAEREALIASVKNPKGDKKGGEAKATPSYFLDGHDHCLDNTSAENTHDLTGAAR